MKIPWRKEDLLTPVFWPRKFHGLYSPWGRTQSDMTMSDFHSLCAEQDWAILQVSSFGLSVTA